MVYRRKYSRKGKFGRKRKFSRWSKRRSYSKRGFKKYYFKRNVLKTAIVQTPTFDLLGTMIFALTDVPNYTEFTAMFDQYKINRVKVRFIPQYNVQQMSIPSANNVVPKLFTIVDVNDSTAPASLNAMREYSNVKVTRGFKEKKMYFKPATSMAVEGGGVFTSSAMSHTWVSTANPGVTYYGVKYGVDAGGGAQTLLQKWDVECVYYMSFARPK